MYGQIDPRPTDKVYNVETDGLLNASLSQIVLVGVTARYNDVNNMGELGTGQGQLKPGVDRPPDIKCVCLDDDGPSVLFDIAIWDLPARISARPGTAAARKTQNSACWTARTTQGA